VLHEWATTATVASARRPHRPTLRTHQPARLWLALAWLPAAVLGGCITQDYVRTAGQSAARGAMQA